MTGRIKEFKNKHRKAFTLAEILIVIAIIGVLVAVSIPLFSTHLEKSREETDVANLRAAKAAGVACYLANNESAGTYWYDAEQGYLVTTPEEKKKMYNEGEYCLVHVIKDTSEIPGYGKGNTKEGQVVPEKKLFKMSTKTDDERYYKTSDNVRHKIIRVVIEDSGDLEYEGSVSLYWEDAGEPEEPTTAACFKTGTEVMMADGTSRNIEDIKLGDTVMTLNHMTGKLEGKEVYFVFSGDGAEGSTELKFSDGNSVSIVGSHCLFEQEDAEYVTVSEEDAENFIGRHFYDAASGRYVELTGVEHNCGETEYYAVYAKDNINCLANGMLSVDDDAKCMLNIYEFNDDLTADTEALQRDIETYGIYEFDENDIFSRDSYEHQQGRYLNIMTGKGLITMDEIRSLYMDELAE